MVTSGPPPANWYPDPANAALWRWWDGTQWTAYTNPRLPDTVAAAAPTGPVSAAPTGPVSEVLAAASGRDERRGGLFGGRKELEQENVQLREQLAAMGITERDRLRVELESLRTATATARDELESVRREVVETRDQALLQEVGIYEYHHPLDDSVAFKARLTGVQARIKDAARAGSAVRGSTNWTVNGSTREGTRMVREFSKLMLRAYNNEADNAVRSMKPYTLDSALARLDKSREAIVKLGHTMNIRVTDEYHYLRRAELTLTADYLAKVAEEKERERGERERQRDEAKAAREIEREQDRLRKEQAHYAATLAGLRANANADDKDIAHAESKLVELEDALDGVNRRAANLRAGWVYVISNVGAFGPKMVKVGMTRRLDPMDRIHELGDASVPFRYDVHATISSDDAVGLETALHHLLADRRVNLVNSRREFFYATPAEVRDKLQSLDAALVSFAEEPTALEWRQSETSRRNGQLTVDAPDLDAGTATRSVFDEEPA